MLGELDELSRRQSLRLREARDRGDVFAAVNLRVGIPNLAWLCRDEPDEARRNGDLAIGEWSQGGFYFQHAFHLIGRVHAHLYAGEPEAGLELLSRAGPAMRRSLVLRNQMMRATLATLRASCAINAAASGRDRDANRAVAARDARRLAREGVRWTDAHALTARAGLARIDGDEGEARGLLASAAAAYEDAEMALHAAAAQLQLARLQPDGEARAEAAEALFRAEQVLQPAKLARMLVPGFGAE
jgi:hypothetical protein